MCLGFCSAAGDCLTRACIYISFIFVFIFLPFMLAIILVCDARGLQFHPYPLAFEPDEPGHDNPAIGITDDELNAEQHSHSGSSSSGSPDEDWRVELVYIVLFVLIKGWDFCRACGCTLECPDCCGGRRGAASAGETTPLISSALTDELPQSVVDRVHEARRARAATLTTTRAEHIQPPSDAALTRISTPPPVPPSVAVSVVPAAAPPVLGSLSLSLAGASSGRGGGGTTRAIGGAAATIPPPMGAAPAAAAATATAPATGTTTATAAASRTTSEAARISSLSRSSLSLVRHAGASRVSPMASVNPAEMADMLVAGMTGVAETAESEAPGTLPPLVAPLVQPPMERLLAHAGGRDDVARMGAVPAVAEGGGQPQGPGTGRHAVRPAHGTHGAAHGPVLVRQDSSDECCVCFERSRDAVLSPCAHACVCAQCAARSGRAMARRRVRCKDRSLSWCPQLSVAHDEHARVVTTATGGSSRTRGASSAGAPSAARRSRAWCCSSTTTNKTIDASNERRSARTRRRGSGRAAAARQEQPAATRGAAAQQQETNTTGETVVETRKTKPRAEAAVSTVVVPARAMVVSHALAAPTAPPP